MSWLPACEIGLWNAWLLMLYFPPAYAHHDRVDNAVGTGDMMKQMGDVPYDKGERMAFAVMMVLIVLLLACSIFLPLKLGTMWFYVSLAIYLVGLVMFFAAMVDIARTPLAQPFPKGMYRYSRHPMMLAESMIFVGVGIASASWLFLLLSAVIIVLQIIESVAEERGCLETYGDEHQEYLNQTPRWIGFPQSGRAVFTAHCRTQGR